MASCSSSVDDMEAGLKASYSSAVAGGSLSISMRQKLALSQCDIQALAVGGSAEATEPVLTTFSGSTLSTDVAQALTTYISKGLDFGSNSATLKVKAQPLWYKLNYVDNLQPATVDVTLHYNSAPVPPGTYTAMHVVPTICDNDKEKETPVNARVVGGDGTVYFSGQIFPATPCGDNNCGGKDYYWGTHGQTYDDIDNFNLIPPMPTYLSPDTTIEISGPGDTWTASFAILGITAAGDRKQLTTIGCTAFNGAASTGPVNLGH